MNIGILLPRSATYPAIAFDFIDGIKAAINANGLSNDINLITENIGYAGIETEVYEKVESFLLQNDVEFVIAFMDFKILYAIEPLFEAINKLLIVVNPGANYPTEWIPKKNIIHLNLQLGFMSWLTGNLAAQNENKKGINCTTFYDCGYFHNLALINAFAKKDGQIQFNYVNNTLYDDSFNINELEQFLQQNEESNLLCCMDTLPANLLYQNLRKLPYANKLQLFVSSLMLQENTTNPFAVNGYTTWMESLPTKENELFKQQYFSYNNKTATLFSVLGWEAGIVCCTICNYKNVENNNLYFEHLLKTTLNGPRGNIYIDPKTNFYYAKAYQVSYNAFKEKPIFIEAQQQRKEWEAFTDEKIIGVYSAWTNTYLCY